MVDHRARTLLLALLAGLVAASCGGAHPESITPPTLTVIINDQPITTMLNGYQWSGPGLSTVADAANRPAADLRTYRASPGAVVQLRFPYKPGALNLAEWKQDAYVGQQRLTETTFRLPMQPANYTFEVTAHWGASNANYDFDVDTR